MHHFPSKKFHCESPSDETTGDTTSHPTKQTEGCQVVGYSQSTRPPQYHVQVHPQGVRRGCKGLKSQQRTQAGYVARMWVAIRSRKPAVVRDQKRAAGEFEQRIFERAQGFLIEAVKNPKTILLAFVGCACRLPHNQTRAGLLGQLARLFSGTQQGLRGFLQIGVIQVGYGCFHLCCPSSIRTAGLPELSYSCQLSTSAL